MKSWMRKRLLTSAVKVRLQPLNSAREKKAGNEENCIMEESKTITRLQSKNRPEKDHQMEETEKIEAVMMCWKNLEGSLVEEPDKETDDQEGRADNKMQE